MVVVEKYNQIMCNNAIEIICLKFLGMERDRWSIKVITIRNQILHRVHTKL
jgi:hypothetical protein